MPAIHGPWRESQLGKKRKKFVIKKLNLRSASSRERKAAEQEAQLLSQLKHPNIVTYRESWEGEDGLLYIVMGFCEGGDLYHKLKKQKGKLLPENQVVEWFVQIAMALQYLHENHILHRDLKTQNVFLTRTNIIKVGDLGIARVLENQYDMASTLIGTPYYMSPELFSNRPYSYKSDVWALGCCVYEMTTLKHAFNAKDMNSLVYRIIEGKLPPIPKDYSPQLAELIRTMLNKKPEERPSVRSILRQPYIKSQISLFLEATKAKTSKNYAKNCERNPRSSASVKADWNEAKDTTPNHSSGDSRTHEEVEEEHVLQKKPVDGHPSEKPLDPKNNTNSNTNCLGASLATISKVDVDILPSEGGSSKSDHLLQDHNPRHLSISSEVEEEHDGSRVEEGSLQENSNPSSETENIAPVKISVPTLDEESDACTPLQPICKEKHDQSGKKSAGKQEKVSSLLQPWSSVSEPSLARQRRQKEREQSEELMEHRQFSAVPPRPLPSLPPPIVSKTNVKSPLRDAKTHDTEATGSGNKEDRPLSARERRRLKQSQEELLPSAFLDPTVRRASQSAAEGTKLQATNHPGTARQSSPDSGLTQEKVTVQDPSDDELSSTSSTDKSDIDSSERRGHTSEMNDLVQLMTQTLKMDSKESREIPPIPNPTSEFKLHKKYRDTLILHGKVTEDSEELKFKHLSPGQPNGRCMPVRGKNLSIVPGSEKIRRMVEVLRADVVQGLGVKLLEKVYDLMEEDDELKREVCLREHMGEKYTNYCMKARQLKFFEENVNF
ncbi:serine/threonine-protein kinase Nek4 isoform X2 [Ornithorhynchus anatinus]|uniref:serine/threonine-protein kinase Nek4 isoform X2 n=1 Tax=Ornithorhynchus anatinus TaxID=9258 RepID=UPI0010A7E8CB|nr:serine/threonine-protein kinase Nek4 isoform X2 [Ornithorhynchus anatinus]